MLFAATNSNNTCANIIRFYRHPIRTHTFFSPLENVYMYLQCVVVMEGPHEREHVFTSLSVEEQSVLVPNDQAACQSWEQLRSELLELCEITKDLAKLAEVCIVHV